MGGTVHRQLLFVRRVPAGELLPTAFVYRYGCAEADEQPVPEYVYMGAGADTAVGGLFPAVPVLSAAAESNRAWVDMDR